MQLASYHPTVTQKAYSSCKLRWYIKQIKMTVIAPSRLPDAMHCICETGGNTRHCGRYKYGLWCSLSCGAGLVLPLIYIWLCYAQVCTFFALLSLPSSRSVGMVLNGSIRVTWQVSQYNVQAQWCAMRWWPLCQEEAPLYLHLHVFFSRLPMSSVWSEVSTCSLSLKLPATAMYL